MKLLALDTSSAACSVALTVDGKTSDRHVTEHREHTRLLIPMIRELLEESTTSPEDLDALVLGNGPGSFIGLRIAASVAQGLAHGAGLDIVPVSSMAAVAAEVFSKQAADIVVVAQDARMQQVYLASYRLDALGLPVVDSAERIATQAEIPELERGDGSHRVAAGAGWQRYPDLLAANRGRLDAVSDVEHPAARYLLPLGAALYRDGAAIAPQDVVPAYLRHTVATPPEATRP